MYKRILLPLDGSPLAEQALAHAVAHADHFQAELTLLRVLVPLPRPATVADRSLTRAEHAMSASIHEYLERIAAGIRERGISVRTASVEGRPHIEIVQFAETNQIDLIVMSTRGQSGLSRWMMGSIADRVVRGAGVPVLLVRQKLQSANET